MKKIIVIISTLFIFSAAQSQVFNTGSTLKKGEFSLGLEPLIYGGANEFMMFFHGGYGLKSGVDLGISAGFLNGQYFGADLEWRLMRYISLTTGAHYFGDFGLDGTLNLTFPIRKDTRIFTGVDVDINFPKGSTVIPLWIPIGVELGLRKNMAFILEGEIALTNNTNSILGGGIVLYF
jgi:hypothetical protein